MNSAINKRYAQELVEERTIAEIAAAGSLWEAMRLEVETYAEMEPILATFFHATILNHDSLEAALSFQLASKLDSPVVSSMLIREIIEEAIRSDPSILYAAEIDIKAAKNRDPACEGYSMPFLYYKGFHSLQAYRVAHWLWSQDRRPLAWFIQNQMSAVFGVDIHPAARIGCGIMLDHATGLVVGETAVVEDDVSILQSVTLGGTGKETGDRHPKIRQGVLIGAGAEVIGNIEVGEGAKVGAGSVVLKDVPPHVTVAGVPAEIVGRPKAAQPALDVDHSL
jgi:serine O-acetyltransferase|tara:strand:- start:1602 stop:2441 length:840 start_codon:yes stop_codon:yes gene_type:complete